LNELRYHKYIPNILKGTTEYKYAPMNGAQYSSQNCISREAQLKLHRLLTMPPGGISIKNYKRSPSLHSSISLSLR